uniref:Uncharacterized protein n=1 Tax=Rhizophagus irregularis (strain DAOM 181602 / DAOM 197198 / MUCL 43194) TaxID=747089 RepID=U9U8N1_RHIID
MIVRTLSIQFLTFLIYLVIDKFSKHRDKTVLGMCGITQITDQSINIHAARIVSLYFSLQIVHQMHIIFKSFNKLLLNFGSGAQGYVTSVLFLHLREKYNLDSVIFVTV